MSLTVFQPRRRLVRPVAVAGAVVALAAAWFTSAPPSHADHGGIHVELLTGRAAFTDSVEATFKVKLDGRRTTVLTMDDPSATVVARITVPAGVQFPWHTHPGPVLVNVAQGALVYQNASDCIERGYPAGTAFVDPGRGNVHTAWNPSSSGETVLIATFFEVPPAPAPLTITEGVVPGDC